MCARNQNVDAAQYTTMIRQSSLYLVPENMLRFLDKTFGNTTVEAESEISVLPLTRQYNNKLILQRNYAVII